MPENFKSSGIFTKQAHVNIPEGLYEEEHGREGFFGRVSQLYHENPPVNWDHIEGELRPRLLPSLFGKKLNPWQKILSNQDVEISLGHLRETPRNYKRNADFDELYFIHQGLGKMETSFGVVSFKKGDYIILPRGTTYKIFIETNCDILLMESRSEFEEPTRGILGPNALYDQSAIFVPEAAMGTEQKKEYIVEVKRLGKITSLTYSFNPLDVRGWKGSVYPKKLSIYDICPIMSHRYHIPPSGHSTFIAKNFVVCSFVERPLEDAAHKVLKVPFYHANIDYDEVLFYHQGTFFSRDNIAPGALTFHPQGIHHGPHPKAYESIDDRTYTDEYAVMIDTRHPLTPSSFFMENQEQDYWKSWMT